MQWFRRNNVTACERSPRLICNDHADTSPPQGSRCGERAASVAIEDQYCVATAGAYAGSSFALLQIRRVRISKLIYRGEGGCH